MKKVLFPLMVLLAVACTAGIYYLLFDEQTTKLFYMLFGRFSTNHRSATKDDEQQRYAQ